MKTIACGLALVMAAGCATLPELTREEYLALVNRTYEGVASEEALAAAEQLFRLADPKQVQFQHFEDGFRVYRRWLVYMVFAAGFGTDIWDVRTTPTEEGTRLTVHLSVNRSSVVPVPVAGDTVASALPGGGGMPLNSTAIYDLFWGRMDYLLGRRDEWMTCDEAEARREAGITYGLLEALCSVTTDDLPPE